MKPTLVLWITRPSQNDFVTYDGRFEMFENSGEIFVHDNEKNRMYTYKNYEQASKAVYDYYVTINMTTLKKE